MVEPILGMTEEEWWPFHRPPTDPKKVPENLEWILKYYFGFPEEGRCPPYVLEILEAMFRGGKLSVNLPTDHCKSLTTTFFFPILSLAHNPQESHIICGATGSEAVRRLLQIQRELESNRRLVGAYPHLAKPQDAEGRIWTATQFNVVGRTVNRPDPSVCAVGWTGNEIRQRRGIPIMDDIESEKVYQSPTERRRLQDFVFQSAARCLEEKHESRRPLLCLVGTPMDVDSIHFKVGERGWKRISYPVWAETEEFRQDGSPWIKRTYLWEKQKEKVLEHYHMLDKRHFSIMYLMDPSGGDPTVLSERDIGKAMLESVDFPVGIEPRTFVSLDPAAGRHRATGADYAGVVVGRIHWEAGDELPYVHLLEAHQYTEGLFEQVDFCAALAAQYQCEVIYEVNSQQGGQYANAFMHKHPETRLIRHLTTNSNKADKYGLTILKTLLRQKRLLAKTAVHNSAGARVLREEIRDLGKVGADDHIAMALWFLVHYAYQTARYYNGPKLVGGFGGSSIVPYRSFGGFGYQAQRQIGAPRDQEQRLFQEALTRRRA